jgi:hypothetical protein
MLSLADRLPDDAKLVDCLLGRTATELRFKLCNPPEADLQRCYQASDIDHSIAA